MQTDFLQWQFEDKFKERGKKFLRKSFVHNTPLFDIFCIKGNTDKAFPPVNQCFPL